MPTKTILVQGEGLGRGDDKLGKLLMANFLRLLGDNPQKPAAVIFWNAGVRLLVEGSPALEHVKKLEEQGVEVLACTTCLEFFELEGKIKAGKPTTMGKSIQSMLNTDIICL
jgi:selenium metabolism protein YedF